MQIRSQILMLIAGMFIGAAFLLSIQSIVVFDSIAALLADESASAVVRNYGLLAFGLFGIAAAVIRLAYTDTQQEQDKRSDLFDRFQKSSHMLDSDNISVRQAGLYTLAEIAKEQPAEFYVMVQSLFCGFLRHESTQQRQSIEGLQETLKHFIARSPDWPAPRADVRDAISLFSQLRKVVPDSKKIEKNASFTPDLAGLFVPGYTLKELDLSRSVLSHSIFCDSNLLNVNLSSCSLKNVNMDRSIINFCDMTECAYEKLTFRWSQISRTTLEGFAEGWVDFTGAAAQEFHHSDSGGVGRTTLQGLAKHGVSAPQFDDFQEQAFARLTAAEREEFEPIEAPHSAPS